MPLILPNTISNGQPADGDKLETNFDTIEAFVNQEIIVRDGSVAMQQPLLLPGNPTQPNQASNKKYVDDLDAAQKTYTDTHDATTLASAKTYTNGLAVLTQGGQGSAPGDPLLFQNGLFNAQTDPNGYASISWPTAFRGIPTTGDGASRPDCGASCIRARGIGEDVINVTAAFYALGGFNARSALIRVFNPNGTAAASVFTAFHWIVWGPRP